MLLNLPFGCLCPRIIACAGDRQRVSTRIRCLVSGNRVIGARYQTLGTPVNNDIRCEGSAGSVCTGCKHQIILIANDDLCTLNIRRVHYYRGITALAVAVYRYRQAVDVRSRIQKSGQFIGKTPCIRNLCRRAIFHLIPFLSCSTTTIDDVTCQLHARLTVGLCNNNTSRLAIDRNALDRCLLYLDIGCCICRLCRPIAISQPKSIAVLTQTAECHSGTGSQRRDRSCAYRILDLRRRIVDCQGRDILTVQIECHCGRNRDVISHIRFQRDRTTGRLCRQCFVYVVIEISVACTGCFFEVADGTCDLIFIPRMFLHLIAAIAA